MLLPDDPLVEPAAARTRSALLRGVSWTTLDQAISSCTNFGIAVVAARNLSRPEFGAFALAASISMLVLGVARALATEPLLSRPHLAEGSQRAGTFGAAAGAMVGVGCIGALVVGLAGVLLTGHVGRALLALALVLPALCLQDSLRYCFISQGHGQTAAVNDSLWLLTQLPAVAILGANGRWSPVTVLLAWGGGAAAAGIVGTYQARTPPRLVAGWSWLVRQLDLGGRYCLEFLIANGGTQAALVGLGAISGLSALGAVRGAQTFLGPLGILFGGILLAVVPTATALRDTPDRLRRVVVMVSLVVCTCAVVWTVVGLVLPDDVGEALFGETWSSAREVVLPLGLMLVASAAAAGPFVGLRALSAAREGLHVRLLTLPIIVGTPLAAAAAADAGGFSYGLAAATSIMAGIYWRQFSLANAQPR